MQVFSFTSAELLCLPVVLCCVVLFAFLSIIGGLTCLAYSSAACSDGVHTCRYMYCDVNQDIGGYTVTKGMDLHSNRIHRSCDSVGGAISSS